MGKRMGCRRCRVLASALAVSITLNILLVLSYTSYKDKPSALSTKSIEYPVSGAILVTHSVLIEKANTHNNETQAYQDKDTPSMNSNKTYMDAKYITDTTSNAYKLKQYYEMSDVGIWTVNGRYCAAVGSFYTTDIGTEFDVILTSGEVIECILADCKDNKDTDETNRQNPNGSVVEFVVKTEYLPETARKMGDLSYISDMFSGEIDYIRVYGGK